jgi:myo-inositol-1(or 4)-monophosphatase
MQINILELNNTELELYLEVAVNAAKKAGAIQMQCFRNHLKVEKNLAHDIKLEIDRLCENAILDTISAHFPDHSYLSEEIGLIKKKSRMIWIIDPLDGTCNFFQGLPFFCTSISCYIIEEGTNDYELPVIGVIYLPLLDELYYAIKGQGSYFNNNLINRNYQKDFKDAVIATSFGSSQNSIEKMGRILTTLAQRVKKIRCFGSSAIELCYIAAGHLDGVILNGISQWDFSAAKIILEESGLKIKATKMNHSKYSVIAGAENIFNELTASFEE